MRGRCRRKSIDREDIVREGLEKNGADGAPKAHIDPLLDAMETMGNKAWMRFRHQPGIGLEVEVKGKNKTTVIGPGMNNERRPCVP